MCTFSIADSTLGGEYDEGLKIRFFKPFNVLNEMPAIQSSGDVLLLRSIKIWEKQGVIMGLSSHSTYWTVFPAASIPEKAPPNAVKLKYSSSSRAGEPSQSEMRYAIELCNLRDRSNDQAYVKAPSNVQPEIHETPTSSSAPSTATSGLARVPSSKSGARGSLGGRDKFALIKDLQIDTFYDIVGQVVTIFPNVGRLVMNITDYTSHNMLYSHEWDKEEKENRDYGDQYGYMPTGKNKSQKWPGPYGKMALMVTLWPPHSHFAQSHVKEWDFVLLQNVRAKQDRDLKMEGALSTDKHYPSKICVSVLSDHNDERVKDVLRRKQDYTQKFNAQSAQLIAQAKKQNGESKPLSKGQLRRKRKQERERAAREKDEPLAKKPKPLQDDEDHDHSEPIEEEKTDPAPETRLSKNDLNKNIHCSDHTKPTRPLSSILSLDTHQNTSPAGNTYTLPFLNINSRATVRVVDFLPSNLADFSVPSGRPSEYTFLSDYEPSDSDSDSDSNTPTPPITNSEAEEPIHSPPSQSWEWRFALILEDASPSSSTRDRLTAYVAAHDAEFLLKLDAEDLRASDTALETLREKLFLLWGDLEERKAAGRVGKEEGGLTRKKEDAGPRSKPFQCCLKEYGIKGKGKGKGKGKEAVQSDADDEEENAGEEVPWERRWGLFGTTII